MLRFSRVTLVVLTALCFASSLGNAQQRPRDIEEIPYFEELEDLAVVDSLEAGARSKKVSFRALGRQFQLEMEPVQLYRPDAVIRWITSQGEYTEKPVSVHYRGKVVGERGSWARLSAEPGSLSGLVKSEGELYFIRPSGTLTRGGPSRTVVYRLSDVPPPSEPFSCASDFLIPGDVATFEEAAKDPMRSYQALVERLQAQAAIGPLKEVEIHVVADGAYYAKHLGDSAARMASVISDVNGIYENELGLTLRISGTTVYTPQTDPYSASPEPSTLLNSFTNTGNPSTGHDLAHLFTGRDLSGSTVGVAWLGVVCKDPYGTGLSQDLSNATYRMLVTGHEIGHNLSAIHDGTGECSSTPSGYLMWYMLDPNAKTFSGCSKAFVQKHIDTRTCLSVADPDFTVAGSVGVGTDTPDRAVHLKGPNAVFRMDRSVDSAAFMLTRTDAGGNPLKSFVVGVNSTGPNDGEFVINDLGPAVAGGGVRRMTIDSTGDTDFTGILSGAGYFQTSSLRFKTDVKTLEDPLRVVSQLRGVRFDWKASGRPSVGVIAEEVALVLPEAVSWDASGMQAQGVNYDSIAALLLEAAKAKEAEILRLEAKRQRLSDLLEQLKHLNRNVEGGRE